ncbi:hypothetical protein GCM10027097_56830 [Amycolatopsis acidiphila]
MMTKTADEAERAADEESDPFTALSRFVHAVAEHRVTVLCPLLAGYPMANSPELETQKKRVTTGVDALVRAAQQAGQVRDDVSYSDLLMSLAELTRPLAGWTSIDHLSHRNLQIFLDGLRGPAQTELPGRPATVEDLRANAKKKRDRG